MPQVHDVGLVSAQLPAPAAGWFTTRVGGGSSPPYDGLNLGMHVEDEPDRVHANRALVAAAAGLHVDDLVLAEQVHGAGVAVVDRSSAGGRSGVAGVDALVTSTPGLGLLVLAADCLPVLLADAAAGVVAAAHAGRQGLAAGVLGATLAAMQELGATPGGTCAVLGPAACGACYEVPAALADEVEQRVPGSRATTRRGTSSVDLVAGARRLLHDAGVARIDAVPGCTIEEPERWFSYRRSGVTGRHGGLVQLR